MSTNEPKSETSNQLLDESGLPILTPEEQVEVDTLNGPFSFGARIFAIFEKTYYPAIVLSHSDNHSQYQVICTENKLTHDKKYTRIIPLSCLQIGDEVFVHDKNEEFIGFNLTYIPSKNNPDEWFAGKFKAKRQTDNVEVTLNWFGFYAEMRQGPKFKKRFTCTCETDVPTFSLNRSNAIVTTPIRPNISITSPIRQTSLARDLRASNRRSKNDTAESNSTTSTNKAPAKRPRKKKTVEVKQSPSRSTISLHDSDEDLLAHHPELLMENQVDQPEQNYAIPSFSIENNPTTSSTVPANRRGRKRPTANVSGDISINELGQKFWQLKEEGKLEPYKLNFGNKEVEIPRCFLDSRSDVFAQLPSSSNGNAIKIEGCKPEAADVFVEYLYCGKSEKLDECAFDLLPLAEKYEMNELKTDCLKCLDTLITDDTLFDWIGEIPKNNKIKAIVLDFIKNKASDDTILSFIGPKWFAIAREISQFPQGESQVQEITDEVLERRDAIKSKNRS